MPESYTLVPTTEGWAVCPLCGRKRILRVLPETVVEHLPVLCKLCRREIIVNIAPESVPKKSASA